MKELIFALTFVLLAHVASSCGPRQAKEPEKPPVPDSPWIWTVGLPPTERAMFEAESARNVVLVKYDTRGKMEILPGCGQSGEYEFVSTMRTLEVEPIEKTEDIQKKFPLMAQGILPRTRQGESLEFLYTIAGMNTVQLTGIKRRDLVSGCKTATHYVRSMAMGAFELVGRTPRKAPPPLLEIPVPIDGGIEESPPPAPPAEVTVEERLFEAGGQLDTCMGQETAAKEEETCRTIIRLYLEPIIETAGE